MTKALLLCGVVGPALFVLVFLVEGMQRPGYRARRHFVSLLAHGERGYVQTLNFFVCGVLALCFAVGVARAIDSVALTALFGMFGTGLLFSARYRCDGGLGYPPTAPASWPRKASPSGNRHNLAGAIVFLALSLATFVAASHSDSRAWTLYCIASGVIMLVMFVVAGVLAERDARGAVVDPPIGIAQRIAIIAGWVWMPMFAWRLVHAAPQIFTV